VEGSCHGLIKVVSQNLPGGTEENHKEPWDSLCPGRDTNQNQESSEYKSEALPPEPDCCYEI
jgi:hypothetical protein